MSERKETMKMIHHGQNVERFRRLRGIKQAALAEALNISQQNMSLIEKKAKIEDDMLAKISEFINIPLEVLKNFTSDHSLQINDIDSIENNKQVQIVGELQQNNNFCEETKLIKELYEKLLDEKNKMIEFLQDEIKRYRG